MNPKSKLSPTRRLFSSDAFRRHYVSAVESGDRADWDEQAQGGNLGRVFVFLLLLHVFLIGAIVLYNIVSERPKAPSRSDVDGQVTGKPGETENGRPKRSEMVEYSVRSGDSLKSISEATGTPQEEIVRINRLEDGDIFVGRKIYVPAPKTQATQAAVTPAGKPGAPPAPAPAPAAVSSPRPQPETFTAADASTKTEATKKPQDAPPAPVVTKTTPVKADTPPAPKPDKVPAAIPMPVPVKIVAPPVKEPGPAPEPQPPAVSGRTHEVKPKETFYSISRKLGVKVNDLMKLNGYTDPGKLQPGVVLKVPAK